MWYKILKEIIQFCDKISYLILIGDNFLFYVTD